MKRLIALFILIILIAVPATSVFADETDSSQQSTQTANVVYYMGNVSRVEKITPNEDGTLGYNMLRQICEIEILTGPFEGRVYEIQVNVNYSQPQQLIMEVGTKVMLSAQLTEDGSDIANIYVYDYFRINWFVVFSYQS